MSKEVKRYEAMLLEDNPRLQNILPQGAILCGKEPVAVYLASDYEALLEENKLLSATQYGSGRMQALRDERDALLAERDALSRWKQTAEYWYGQYRLAKYGETPADHPVEGALDAWHNSYHGAQP